MKNLALVAMLFVMVLFMSCRNQTREEVTVVQNTKTTITEPNGFALKTQVVVKGNTVWGFSEKQYGTGMRWRDIVAQNPFLSDPKRLYYDDSKKMWIVIIYPGEVIKLAGEVINPSYVVEETTTTTTVKNTENDSIPWWGWVLLTLSGILIIWGIANVICYWRRCCCSGVNHVNINVNSDIDCSTRAYFLGREQDFRNRALGIIERDARRNSRLTEFTLNENANDFSLTAKYSERFNQQPKKEEDKK